MKTSINAIAILKLLVAVTGVGLAMFGIWHIYPPASYIFAGVAMIASVAGGSR